MKVDLGESRLGLYLSQRGGACGGRGLHWGVATLKALTPEPHWRVESRSMFTDTADLSLKEKSRPNFWGGYKALCYIVLLINKHTICFHALSASFGVI